ncbi:hypothetical protein VNI00_002987 [Paramarasmius palmivorus]|uniref:MFS general substrate transporter n=1 Tax=Paramarasmius palmivorus TaxID=297713 RepID=A0AAW0DYF0_9AGAR
MPSNASFDEKSEKSSPSLFDVSKGDEALQVVGIERTAEFSEEYNRKLRRKLDLLISPLCAAVYFTQFLDKTSLNYASIMGLPIVGQKYNLVSMAFFLGKHTPSGDVPQFNIVSGYLFFEFPTVYLSQKTRVAKYLGVNIVIWGIILALHAVANSFGAFFALRFLLGMCESCVAPILILIISMFYKKNEQVIDPETPEVLVIDLSGLGQTSIMVLCHEWADSNLRRGISFYDGVNIASWKIVYILLGGLAVVVGICVLIWLPDSPMHAHFLTAEERVAALERVRENQAGVTNRTWKKDQVIEAFTDVRTWLLVLTTLLANIPNGGITSFSNLIIKGFGYSTKQTLILSTPAGAISSITVLLCGWYSDRKGERMLPIVYASIPTIIGCALLVGLNDSGNKGVLLFAIYFIGTFGSSGSSVYAYNASNIGGHTKKSTVNATTLFVFSIGNIIGTEIFLPKDAPAYIPGKTAIMTLLIVQIFVCFLLRWINIRMNKEKQAQIEELRARKGWSEEDVQKERERHAFQDLTDKQNIYFVYTP